VQITLLRHGKPDFVWNRVIRGSEVKHLQKQYDASGIIDNPPLELQRFAEQHNCVVCSDFPRSIQSATALGASTIHLSDEEFREISIPCFDNVSMKLPIKLWVVILRVLWLFGFSKNTESISAVKHRARRVSEKLVELAHKHNSVLFVGHGTLNHFVAKELLANAWLGPSTPGRKHWEFGIYRYENT
jgi:broad specificity phosphatase PhoE